MHTTPTYLKRLQPLCCWVCLHLFSQKKNTHAHTRYAMEDLQGHTMVHQPGTCLICEFQMAADADMPACPTLNPPLAFSIHSPETDITPVSSPEFLQFSLRGPPAI
ncbi:MAG: hypothetical protein IPG86_20290 [Chitinophagaceae bacterium]|nr:hypothetical protein [Chitinophagaceae bacterium]